MLMILFIICKLCYLNGIKRNEIQIVVSILLQQYLKVRKKKSYCYGACAKWKPVWIHSLLAKLFNEQYLSEEYHLGEHNEKISFVTKGPKSWNVAQYKHFYHNILETASEKKAKKSKTIQKKSKRKSREKNIKTLKQYKRFK